MSFMSLEDARQSASLLARSEIAPWVDVAVSARLNAEVLGRLMPPREGSFLRPTADDPLKKMAWWCHGYLEAAADHLVLWADYFAPLKAHPDATTVHTLRPVFTLARAAMESASQAIWSLGPTEPHECGRRFIQLVLWDVNEQAKAAAMTESGADLHTLREEMLRHFGMTARSFKPPRYLDMIRYVAEFLDDGDSASSMTPAHVERIWRSTSGAAHGKQWPDFEFTDRADAGDGLVYSTPRVDAISEVLGVAADFLSAGVILFAMRAGHWERFEEIWDEAAEGLGLKLG
jgi:hypothetical protein